MERFSYYGMRAILVLYLTSATMNASGPAGLGLEREHALSIYAIYTSLVYLTPLLGGMLADRFLGARKSIFIGGLVMMLGEIALMLSSASDLGMNFLYLGLALLIFGNGFFKPNASTIVGELYEPNDPRRDGAFTIFYMGINVGAFFSPLVCGTLGEHFGYNVGFAAAAIGMFLGILIFLMGQRKFGKAGFPNGRTVDENSMLNKRDFIDILWITLATAILSVICVALLPYVSDVQNAIPDTIKTVGGIFIVIAVITGMFGLAYKGGDKELLAKIDRAKAYFLNASEDKDAQASTATNDNDNADDAADKADKTDDSDKADDAADEADKADDSDKANDSDKADDSDKAKAEDAKIDVEEMRRLANMTEDDIKAETKKIAFADMKAVAAILIICLFVIFFWLGFEQAGGTMTLFAEEETERHLGFLNYTVPASYFQSINPVFIVLLAPLFSRMWFKIDNSKYKFSIIYKMVIALVLLGLGFMLLYAGQATVVRDAAGAITQKANMLFLVGVYFIHTCGELCLSPVGLSFVTKLSPARMVSLMMGVWLLSSAIANYFAGNLEAMLKSYDVPLFLFLIGSSFGAAVLLFFVAFGLKKWTKGY